MKIGHYQALWQYFNALRRHWVALVTGSLPIAVYTVLVLGFPDNIPGRSHHWWNHLPSWLVFLIAVLGLISAQYRAWLDMRAECETVKRECDSIKAERDLLTTRHNSGTLGGRAYVTMDIRSENRSHSDNRVIINIKNVGGVPATDIKVWYQAGFEKDLPDTFTPIESETLSIDAVMGGQQWPIPRSVPPPGQGVFAYCEVRYNDGFGNTKKSSACWVNQTGLEWEREPKYWHHE